MPKTLVIVESPAKARTIGNFLGKNYVVESSIGHIRDLPKSAKDVPAKHKKDKWSRLGVDVENGFRPLYVVDPEKKEHIKKLKNLLKNADELLLATDEDREGESIAWHLVEVLKPKVPVKRMVFHEITKRAIQEAIDNPREVDQRLVDAQEARRILDRLYGYEVSPVLWKKVMPRLSAGRVQSVATRIIVDRETERMRFSAADYWDIEAVFTSDEEGKTQKVPATLAAVDGSRVATGKDFDDQGKIVKKDAIHLDEKRATELGKDLEGSSFQVASIERKPYRRSPSAPFMTSTLQQEAGRKLRFSSSQTMRAAQRLYESGYITYMRTDSTTLAESAIASARDLIKRTYGAEYLPAQPRQYKKKVKNAQEAHEAIRPAGDTFRHPDQVGKEVGPAEARLYELIWKRTVASQMQDSRGESVIVRIAGESKSGTKVEFVARGNTITFPGFLKAYVEGSDDPDAEKENRERPIPVLSEKEKLTADSLDPRQHTTQPPPRFTEASLVRRLEELGVGRPSTYASIISTIRNRGYVWKKGSALVPSFTAFAVIALLSQHFADLVDYRFTAYMEDELDEIAKGNEETLPWLKRFYFGTTDTANDNSRPLDMGLHALIASQMSEIDARAINSLPLGKDEEGQEVLVRVGRYGAYLQRGEDTASIADDITPDELDLAKATELLNQPKGDKQLGDDPESGLPVLLKTGRFGTYVQVGEFDSTADKPKTASLLSFMSPETITFEDAMKVLALPREIGADPSDGKMITAQAGRYGPYIAKEKDSRNLESDEQIFTLTLEQALELLKQPKQRQRRQAKPPIKEVGVDAVSGKPIILREGRFGLYVTDGETNASLRRGDTPENITNERACELLQMRRERVAMNPTATTRNTVRRGAGKKAAKKAGKKKTGKKKTAKKKTTKTARKKTAKKGGGSKSKAAKTSKKKSSKKKSSKKAKTVSKKSTSANGAPRKKRSSAKRPSGSGADATR